MMVSPLSLRLLAALSLVLGGLWLVLAGTLPMTVSRPDMALAVRASAVALAARAVQVVRETDVPVAAVADSRHALALDPTQVSAVWVLATDAAFRRRPDQVERLLAYSERLSRRDLRTQLLLIESRVAIGDVAGALTHYDRALRTSRSATPLLIPVLVDAANNPGIITPLAHLMASRPLWWRALASGLLTPGPQGAAIGPIYQALHLDPGRPEEASLLAQAMGQLVAARRYPDAVALFRQASGQQPGVLRNGGFDAPLSGLTPFDWSVSDDPDLSASIEQANGADGAALLVTAARKTGSVARQLLLLSPGRYRLTFAAGGDAADAAPRIVLRCDGPPERILASPPATPTAGRAGVEVAVPAGCPAQWLSVDVTATTAAAAPWVDTLRLIALR